MSLNLAIAWPKLQGNFHYGDWEHLRHRGHLYCWRWLVWVSHLKAFIRICRRQAIDNVVSFDISSMSAIIGTWQYKCYFNQGPTPATHKDCTGPRSSVQGGITASMAGGSWVGALLSGFISDILGRKKAIMIGSIIW